MCGGDGRGVCVEGWGGGGGQLVQFIEKKDHKELRHKQRGLETWDLMDRDTEAASLGRTSAFTGGALSLTVHVARYSLWVLAPLR